MKKLLTIAALMGVASLSYGQGSVNFSAGASASTRITGPGGTNIFGAGNYYFALFVAPVATGTNYGLSSSLDPTANGFTFTGAIGTNVAAAGRFNGNPTTDDTIIAGYAAGASAEFVVVGWSANIGLDWTSFHNFISGAGGSVVGTPYGGHSLVADQVQLGGGLIPPGNIFGSGVGQVPGFALTAIPEPASFALAGLGAAALVIFRRRKV